LEEWVSCMRDFRGKGGAQMVYSQTPRPMNENMNEA